MLPLMARDFHRVTMTAPLVNLLAVPLTSVIVPLGFLTTATALSFPFLGKALAAPLGWLTIALLRVVAWFAHFPDVSYRIPAPHTWLISVFFGLAIMLALTFRMLVPWQIVARRSLYVALLSCAALVAIFPFSPQWSSGKLEATVLDVGQGDSIFVVSPQG
jgi:competence protein ComEC